MTYVDDPNYDSKMIFNNKNLIDIDKITKKLAGEAQDFYTKWRSERLEGKQVERLIHSLTHNKTL